jgi:hypothetical protein
MHVERYMKENGTETFEKLVASKVITAKILNSFIGKPVS